MWHQPPLNGVFSQSTSQNRSPVLVQVREVTRNPSWPSIWLLTRRLPPPPPEKVKGIKVTSALEHWWKSLCRHASSSSSLNVLLSLNVFYLHHTCKYSRWTWVSDSTDAKLRECMRICSPTLWGGGQVLLQPWGSWEALWWEGGTGCQNHCLMTWGSCACVVLGPLRF